MKSFKFLFFIFAILLVFSSVHCFSIGVIEPDVTCVKPDRSGAIAVNCYGGGTNDIAGFEIRLENQNFLSLENDTYWFFPNTNRNIPVLLNTTGIEEGFYTSNFIFCPIDKVEDGALGVAYCISSPIKVNVSENCPELPEKDIKPVFDEEEHVFLRLIESKTFKTIFNYLAILLVALIFLFLLNKRLTKKKNKK